MPSSPPKTPSDTQAQVRSAPFTPTTSIVLLAMIALLGPLSMGIFLPAFPHISAEWHIRSDQLALTLSAYMMGTAVGQLVYGPLIDRFGPYKPLMVGLGIYSVSLVVCYLSQNVETLSIARFVQALGACASGLATRVVVRSTYPANQVSAAFSTLTLAMAISPILSPILGDLLIDLKGWRSTFLALGGFAALSALVTWCWFPRLPGDLTTPFSLKETLQQYSAIMKNKTFLFYTLILSFSGACPVIFASASAFVFMDDLHLSRFEYVLAFGFCGSGLVVGALINKWLLKTIPSDRLIVISLLGQFLIVAGAAFYTEWRHLTLNELVGVVFLFFGFQGLVSPNATALSMSEFKDHIGIVSSLNLSISMVVMALGTWLVSLLKVNQVSDLFWIMTAFTLLAFALTFVYRVRLKFNISHPLRDVYLLLGEGK